MGFAVRVRSAGQKYGPTCHQRDRADVTEFVTLERLSSLGQHVGVLALAGYKRGKSADGGPYWNKLGGEGCPTATKHRSPNGQNLPTGLPSLITIYYAAMDVLQPGTKKVKKGTDQRTGVGPEVYSLHPHPWNPPPPHHYHWSRSTRVGFDAFALGVHVHARLATVGSRRGLHLLLFTELLLLHPSRIAVS